ncbi:hypothetical protein EV644_10632 [Kribbella orskensis]|uniref:MYXO-CTERM domain-containing protein n=1 Tax=Kribbella orskensis TaxID=2512216 RepID=A0ABY2BLZ3_9ACTN|nr:MULTISPECIES: hypothetical protein [Kribbella]TCN40105.1 hypothetical protein EV642_10532 [Kribbella sp. VKM Ac-2500]TCO22725.1 hypothetical protein EV644_10632 [Kribbella orskensis]
MNRKYWAAAVSALALGAATLTATEASALLAPEPASGSTTTPDCHWAYHPACEEVPVSVPPAEAALDPGPSADNAAEARQAGASALGGAALAFAGIWLYRRRHAPDI